MDDVLQPLFRAKEPDNFLDCLPYCGRHAEWGECEQFACIAQQIAKDDHEEVCVSVLNLSAKQVEHFLDHLHLELLTPGIGHA